ncbi:Acetylglutamate kinase [Rubripirellula obstinata]|uniref:Acetylglutamate kinase n=1 Tax=Rubripirellula obstinata TaxID=406547 RepID=A0A5B1CEM9_9BACT|nr:Acetylglutamate kinase [Rubripirellula obstinata]
MVSALAELFTPSSRDFSVQEAIAKANTLIEAMGWIRRFRGKTTVIKLGGSLLEDKMALMHILLDVVFMESVGMKPVIVHGGGKAISNALAETGVEAKFIRGRRVTDAATLEVVKRVLAGELNEFLTEEMERLGGRAMNLSPHTTNVLFGEKLPTETDEDLGFVGHVTRVDRSVIEGLHYTDQVPIIPSMCEGEDGQLYNVNADTAAMAVAQSLGAEKLVFLSDVNGVRRDKDDSKSIIDSLSAEEARHLIDEGIIEGGMIPKVEACLETLGRGVRKVHIIDGSIRHSLLLEIFTTSGVGTEIHP